MKRKSVFLFALSLALFALFFAFLAVVRNVDVQAIGPEGTSVGLAGMNGAVRDVLPWREPFFNAADILGFLGIGLGAFFGFMGAFQLFITRKSFFKVDPAILSLIPTYVLTVAAYFIFNFVAVNYRPILMPGEVMPEASFPSSHTMLAVSFYGSAITVIARLVSKKSVRIPLQIVCGVLLILTIAFRLLSGAHWLSDILAAAILSAAFMVLTPAILSLAKDPAPALD